MEFFDLLQKLFTDYTLRTVALGSAVLGLTSGALGTFAVLRRQSLLGDAMSHAALPGIVLAFMLTGSKAPLVLVLGASVAGWAGTLLIMNIISGSRIKSDSAMALILSVFFGFGLMLLTWIQRQPNAAKAGLDKFLFGQAAALLVRDVYIMSALGLIALLFVALLWNQFKLLSFDPEFGKSLGLPMRALDIILTGLLVIAIVIGLQTVGVVLMSAMIVAPAAGARQWTDRLGMMIVLAGIFGALSGIVGAVISSNTSHLPTGPTIVLSISAIVIISLFLAPNRGLVWAWLRQKKSRRRIRMDSVLRDLYLLASQHDDIYHPHEAAAVDLMSKSRGGAAHCLNNLREQGLVRQEGAGGWSMTDAGIKQAREIVSRYGGNAS